MLADTVLAECKGRFDRESGGGATALAKAIQGAGRFDLSPGVVVSAYAVRKSPLSSQLRALSLCRLPFATTWFEWPGADPVYDPFRENTTTATTPTPSRIGALIQTDESRQRGVMTFAWSHRTAGLNICPLAATFDWRENFEEVKCLERAAWRHSGMSETQIDKRMLNSFHTLPSVVPRHGVNADEVLQERRRSGIVWSPIMDGYAKILIRQLGRLPGPGTPQFQAWGGDLAGEPNALRCVILLLNSRNATSAEHVVLPDKLNRARLRSGKAPLLDHTTIRIKLSRAMAGRAGSSENTQREAARFHVVRGHPKIRKSGVYWWSDHGRGNPSRGTVSQGYRVDP